MVPSIVSTQGRVSDIESGGQGSPAITRPDVAHLPSRVESLEISTDIGTTVIQHSQQNNSSEGSHICKKIMNFIKKEPYKAGVIAGGAVYNIAAVTSLGAGIGLHNTGATAAGGAMLGFELLGALYVAGGEWERRHGYPSLQYV